MDWVVDALDLKLAASCGRRAINARKGEERIIIFSFEVGFFCLCVSLCLIHPWIIPNHLFIRFLYSSFFFLVICVLWKRRRQWVFHGFLFIKSFFFSLFVLDFFFCFRRHLIIKDSARIEDCMELAGGWQKAHPSNSNHLERWGSVDTGTRARSLGNPVNI